jgi:hypothetical protein
MVKRVQGTNFIIGKADTGQHAIGEDWKRKQNSLTIDGQPLNELLKPYINEDNEVTEDALKNFFAKVVLGKISDEATRIRAAEYLMTTFHQGGWLALLGTPLTIELATKTGFMPNNPIGTVTIETNNQGFVLTEALIVKEMSWVQDTTQILQPDPGYDYILQASASTQLSFSGDNKPDRVDITQARIDFGSETIKQPMAAGRSFIQCIVDFISKIFFTNKIYAEKIIGNHFKEGFEKLEEAASNKSNKSNKSNESDKPKPT